MQLTVFFKFKEFFKRYIWIWKSKTTIRFPEDVFMYEKNGFQVLGLIPYKADKIRQLTKRKDELSALIKASLQPKDHLKENYYAVPWPGIKSTSESDINNAYSRLQDAPTRIKEELFWFHLEEDNIEPFNCLLTGNFNEGRRQWESKKDDNPKTNKSILATHNLAVLEHALILAQIRAITGTPKLSNAQIDNWKKVFALWINVYRDDKYWDYFRQRIAHLNDPRINNKSIHQLRKELPCLVLNVNMEIAKAALTQEMPKYAKQHLDLIKNSGFDSQDITKVMMKFFTSFIKELKMIIQNLESQSNNKERKELYKEYEFALEKATKIKDHVDKLEGNQYIKREIDKIITIITKQIKKDLNNAIDRTITIINEIREIANFLIKKYNEEASSSSLSLEKVYLIGVIKEKFEENAKKIRHLKKEVSEAVDITEKGKKIFKKMKKLGYDNEYSKKINDDIKWLNKNREELDEVVKSIEEWINRNLKTLRENLL